jgi:transcriptional regulator with XRE-family HTH domain
MHGTTTKRSKVAEDTTTTTPAVKRVKPRRDVTHKIREWRQYRCLTMEQLSKRAGLTASFISQLELGRSSYTQTTLEKLADALECQLWQLLGHDPMVPVLACAASTLIQPEHPNKAQLYALVHILSKAVDEAVGEFASEQAPKAVDEAVGEAVDEHLASEQAH